MVTFTKCQKRTHSRSSMWILSIQNSYLLHLHFTYPLSWVLTYAINIYIYIMLYLYVATTEKVFKINKVWFSLICSSSSWYRKSLIIVLSANRNVICRFVQTEMSGLLKQTAIFHKCDCSRSAQNLSKEKRLRSSERCQGVASLPWCGELLILSRFLILIGKTVMLMLWGDLAQIQRWEIYLKPSEETFHTSYLDFIRESYWTFFFFFTHVALKNVKYETTRCAVNRK